MNKKVKIKAENIAQVCPITKGIQIQFKGKGIFYKNYLYNEITVNEKKEIGKWFEEDYLRNGD